MRIFELIDIDIIVIIALGVTIILANLNMNKKEKLNKLFIKLTTLVLSILILEILSVIIPSSDKTVLIPLHKLVNILGFIIAPIIPYTWILYLKERLKVNISKILLIILIVINTIITVLSYKYGLIFTVDSMNKYHRGVLFCIPTVISCFYFTYASIIILNNRKKFDRSEYNVLMAFCGIPFLGIIIQIILSQMPVIWSYTGIAIIIYYVYLRERTFKYDALTGAWNRIAFETYINNRLSNNNTAFSLVYIDLDDFKKINDNYGHEEGDIVLKTTVALLKNSFKSKGTVVRMGGDEFIVIIYSSKKHIICKMIEDMKQTFIEHNKKSDKPYKIKFSFGYDVYNKKYADIESLVKHVDELMYLDKKSKEMLYWLE